MRLLLLPALCVASCLFAAEGGIIEKRVGAGCASNLKQIAIACHMFADVPENGKFPSALKELVPNYITAEKSLRCLGMKDADPKRCQYVYVPGAKQDSTEDIVAFCPCKGHPEGSGQYVTASGEVKAIAKLADFRKLLKDQLEARKVSFELPTVNDKADEAEKAKYDSIVSIRRELDLPVPEERK